MPRKMPRTVKRYGWRPQLPDLRDKRFDHLKDAPPSMPTFVDMRAQMPNVYDQGDLGSCTANMGAGLFEWALLKYGLTDFMPSRLFIYYNERVIEGDVGTDGGAQCRDALTTLNTQGVCPESEWPYDVSQFAVTPSAQCYTDATKNLATAYLAVDADTDAIKAALAQGYPVGFGFTVYDSFEDDSVAQTGIMPTPVVSESVLGGHAVIRVGYYDNAMLPVTLDNGAILSPHDSGGYYIVRNSWGAGWGDKGYFYMPYGADAFSSDFWILQTVD
jgi:C1A family cysteine protease